MRGFLCLLVFCMSGLATQIKAQPLTAEDLHIMSLVLDSLPKGTTLYVFDSTYTTHRLTQKESAQKAARYAGHFLGDWYTRNAVTNALPVNKLESRRTIIAVKHDKTTDGNHGYRINGSVLEGHQIREVHPYFFPIELSGPGYNAVRDTAYVEVFQSCPGLCGTLWSVVLHKAGTWRIARFSADNEF